MTWKRVAKLFALTLYLASSVPSYALFNPTSVGLPTDPSRPVIGGFDPTQPPVVPPLPPIPPIGITGFGNDWISLSVRPPVGRVSQLFRQPPSGAFEPMPQTLTPGSEIAIRDENLGVGKNYCYRLVITGGSASDEIDTRCISTDWRVGFESGGMSEEESAQVLRLFHWEDTQTLPVGSESEPALYHMNVLVDGADHDAEYALQYLGMHVQEQPIFSEELDGWNDARSVVHEGGALPTGRWFFAVVPGSVYNEIRSRMIEQIGHGEAPGIKALVFRKVPVAEALPVGVSRHNLSIFYLGRMGFVFNGYQRCFTMSDGTHVCQVEQQLLGWIIRKVVHWVAEIGDKAVELVREAIGRIERLIKGEVTLDLTFRLLNTDAAFGTDQVMRSGWSGQELKLKGVDIEVRQGLAAFYEKTDDNGHVTLTVSKNADTRICIQVENDTAEVTEFLLKKTVCVKNIGELSGDTTMVVDARHNYVNALAAMTDARDYLMTIAHITMPKITVLVGQEASELAVQGRSFTPCMGRAPSLLGLGGDLLGFLGPMWLAVGAAAEFTFSVDMVLIPGNDGSRGVPVHEYGHAVMCEMLMRQGLDAFELAWTDLIIRTSDQSPDNQASIIAEAWADFMTAQVVGGTNYFGTTDAVYSENVNYCPAGGSCLEQNFVQGTTFETQVRRVASLLEDAFDGHPSGDGPNDASEWQVGTTPFSHDATDDSDDSDEVIALSGADLETLFEYWDERGELLRDDNFFGGLADLAKARGYSDQDVCNLFALHDSGASCPSFVARRPWMGWVGAQNGALMAAFASAPVGTPRIAPTDPSAPVIASRPPMLVAAIASLAVAAPGSAPTDPGAQPGSEDPCVECAPPVVLDGVQKIQVARAGKLENQTAFAFRMGDGVFEGLDPLGQVFSGAFEARDKRGAKLRLHVGPEVDETLARLLAESAADLGIDGDSIQLDGPAKIELRLAKGGKPVGKITVKFTATVDGKTQHGSYVAKLGA